MKLFCGSLEIGNSGAIIAILMGLVMTVPSIAQEKYDPGELSRMSIEELMNIEITTSSRSEQSVWEASAKVVVVTDKMIHERGYKDLTDILTDMPYFQIQSEYGHWMKGAIVNLRGHRSGDSGNNKVMLLMDGVKISDEAEEGMFLGLNSVPLIEVKQVEIVYGPNSTLYGRDAYAGMINIVTKKGNDHVAGFDYGTYDTRRVYGSVSHHFTDEIYSSLSFSNYTSAEQDPTNISETYLNRHKFPAHPYTEQFDRSTDNTFLKMDFDFLGFSLKYILYDIQAAETYGSNPDFYVTEYSTKTALKNQIFSSEYKNAFSPDFEMKVFYNYKSHEMDPSTANLYTDDLDRTGNIDPDDSTFVIDPFYAYGGRKYYYFRTLAHNAGIQFHYHLSDKLVNVSGFDFHFVNGIPIISEGKGGKPITTDAQRKPLEHEFTNKGIYTEFSYNLTPSILLTAGGRFDINSNYDNIFIPRLAFISRFDNHYLKIFYSGGYLAPSTTQMHFESLTTFSWIKPNTSLKPEKNSSIGLDYTYMMDEAQFSVNFFYNKLTDGILESVQTGDSSNIRIGNDTYYVPILQSKNISNGERYGLSFEYLQNLFQNLEIIFNYSYITGTDRINSHEVKVKDNLVSEHTLNAGVLLRYNKYSLYTGLNYSSKRRIKSFHSTTDYAFMLDSEGYINFDPVFLVNINLRARNLVNGLSFNLHVHNLFDVKYYGQTINATWGSPKILQDLRRVEIGFEYEL